MLSQTGRANRFQIQTVPVKPGHKDESDRIWWRFLSPIAR